MAKDMIAKYGKAKVPAYRESKVRKAERVVLASRIVGGATLVGLWYLLYGWIPALALAVLCVLGGIAVLLAAIFCIGFVAHKYSEARTIIEHSKKAGVLEDE